MLNNQTAKKAIIIGTLHHNTLGVLRALGEHCVNKHDIFVIISEKNASRTNIISSCKYIDNNNIIYVDNDKSILTALNKIGEEGDVIICCSDGAATEIMRHQERFYNYLKTPTLSHFDVKKFMRKDIQDEVAMQCGLTIPFGKVYDTSKEVEWDIFPCIIKPIKSTEGAGKADIRIVRSKEDLIEELQHIHADIIQIQQFISKSMEFQLIGCSLEEGRTILIPGYTDILRQPHNTNTGYLRYNPIDKLNFNLQPVYKLIQRIGYSGLFSVEFIRDDKGNDYFLEINMRNDGNAYCVTAAGVNLPFIWYYHNVYGQLPENEPTTFNDPVIFIPDFSDIKIGISKVGLFGWLKQMWNADCHTTWNNKDPKPFFTSFKQLVRRKMKI